MKYSVILLLAGLLAFIGGGFYTAMFYFKFSFNDHSGVYIFGALSIFLLFSALLVLICDDSTPILKIGGIIGLMYGVMDLSIQYWIDIYEIGRDLRYIFGILLVGLLIIAIPSFILLVFRKEIKK